MKASGCRRQLTSPSLATFFDKGRLHGIYGSLLAEMPKDWQFSGKDALFNS